MISLPDPLLRITEQLIRSGAFPVIVGGYLRDTLLGRSSKDIDIEVYNVKDLETLRRHLEPFGKVNIVGKSFGVLKMVLDEYDIDIALPRTESKTGPGHRGFEVRLNPQLDFATAARRRDFTVNAMGFDLHSSHFLDPYGGRRDLKERTLRCVDPATFVEDPLRVLRAVQMSARFHLQCCDALMLLCRTMVRRGELDTLPKERIFEEIRKLLLKAETPSDGLRLMEQIDLLEKFPELERLYRQGKEAWEESLRALDAMASRRSGDSREELVLMLGALCHRLEAEPDAALPATRRFLERITDDKKVIDAVAALVAHQREPFRLRHRKSAAPALRRLALAVPLKRLARLCEALDPQSGITPWLLQEAAACGAEPERLTPLLQGRDLIAAGMTPSPRFKNLLDAAYEAQLDGLFENREGALEWLNRRISENQNGAASPASAYPTAHPPR